MESEEVWRLIWINIDSFTVAYLIEVACLMKFHFPIGVVLNSMKTQKGLELVFRSQLFCKLLIKFFLL